MILYFAHHNNPKKSKKPQLLLEVGSLSLVDDSNRHTKKQQPVSTSVAEKVPPTSDVASTPAETTTEGTNIQNVMHSRTTSSFSSSSAKSLPPSELAASSPASTATMQEQPTTAITVIPSTKPLPLLTSSHSSTTSFISSSVISTIPYSPLHTASEEIKVTDATARKTIKTPETTMTASSSSTPPTANHNNKTKRQKSRHVRFDSVELKEYAVTVGDHPFCKGYFPLTLDWCHARPREIPINDYEADKARQRDIPYSLHLNARERWERLRLVTGLNERTLAYMEQARHHHHRRQ